MKNALWESFCAATGRVDERLTRRALALGLMFAALLAALTAAYNMTGGLLFNLNDIGSYRNRVLFTAMTAGVHLLLLAIATLLYRKSALRLLFRQIILTAGFQIMLFAINQKTFAYVQQMQPLVRAMDTGALSAIAGAKTSLSAPALTLLYLITRGPVYDMYLVKLFAIACDMLLALLIMRAADARGMGWRAEAALALCLILPQGFMAAACAAMIDHAAVLLLALSLCLCAGWIGRRERPLAGALCFGGAAALSGLALCALPAFVLLILKGKLKPAHLLCAALLALMCCVPAALSGVPAGEAFGSLLRANLGVPEFASGAPNLTNLFPRAVVEEMPGYFMLSHMPEIDTLTNAQPHYTQEHMEIAMRSLALLGIALLLGVWALALCGKEMSELRRALALTLGALLLCPGASAGAWLAADMLCVLALLEETGLRLPACLTLFATMCACAYPVAGEVLLPMILATAMCGAALLMLLGVFPTPGAAHGEGEARG